MRTAEANGVPWIPSPVNPQGQEESAGLEKVEVSPGDELSVGLTDREGEVLRVGTGPPAWQH